MKMKLRNIFLPFLLAVQTVYCWTCFHRAQFLEYDDNYGLIIHGFMVSVVTLIALFLLWYYKARWITFNRSSIILWLLFGSPATFAVAAIYYQNIFGATLAT